MFYLTTHSTHLGVEHMGKDRSYSERGNPLPPHGLLFPISSKGYFRYASSHRQVNTYHGLCYTSRGALVGIIRLMQMKVNCDLNVTGNDGAVA